MTYPIVYDKRDGSGFYINGIAGEALGDRKLVYVGSDGLWRLADADIIVKMRGIGLTIGAIPAGKWGRILTRGFIGLSTWTWTVGEVVYASNVAGELSQTMLDMSSNVVQEIGYALTATQISFGPRLGRGLSGPTYTKHIHVGIGVVKVPAAGAPDVVVQDNTVMLKFNQNGTEDAYLSWEVPTDYAEGDLSVYLHWTNDGGVGDNGNNVRWQLNYQSMEDDLVVSGSHANSPKTINDTYTSAAGWIMHTTPMTTIAAADFSTRHQIMFRLTAIAAAATQLTGESHLLAIMMEYTAYSDL